MTGVRECGVLISPISPLLVIRIFSKAVSIFSAVLLFPESLPGELTFLLVLTFCSRHHTPFLSGFSKFFQPLPLPKEVLSLKKFLLDYIKEILRKMKR